MGARISPEDSPLPLLPKSQQIADKTPQIPMQVNGKKLPVNLITGSEMVMMVRPRGESTDVVEPADRAVQMAIGYEAGGRKTKSVIPKQRKLVKTMIYHSVKDSVSSLFGPPPSTVAGTRSPQ